MKLPEEYRSLMLKRAEDYCADMGFTDGRDAVFVDFMAGAESMFTLLGRPKKAPRADVSARRELTAKLIELQKTQDKLVLFIWRCHTWFARYNDVGHRDAAYDLVKDYPVSKINS